MKKMFTKKFWTILISILIPAAGIVLACGYYDPGPEYGSSNFTPEAFTEKKYSPFFYSREYNYYGINYEDGHSIRFNESNAAE